MTTTTTPTGPAQPTRRSRPRRTLRGVLVTPPAERARKAQGPADGADETAVRTREAGTGAARARAAASRTPRTPFVLLVLALLAGAIVSLLLLNTVLEQDAFNLTELQQNNRQLLQQKQALQQDIEREQSPAVLAAKARALGMVQPDRPAFVDARTTQVIGGAGYRPVPQAAAAAAGAAGVLGVPGAVVPGDGISGWTGGTR